MASVWGPGLGNGVQNGPEAGEWRPKRARSGESASKEAPGRRNGVHMGPRAGAPVPEIEDGVSIVPADRELRPDGSWGREGASVGSWEMETASEAGPRAGTGVQTECQAGVAASARGREREVVVERGQGQCKRRRRGSGQKSRRPKEVPDREDGRRRKEARAAIGVRTWSKTGETASERDPGQETGERGPEQGRWSPNGTGRGRGLRDRRRRPHSVRVGMRPLKGARVRQGKQLKARESASGWSPWYGSAARLWRTINIHDHGEEGAGVQAWSRQR